MLTKVLQKSAASMMNKVSKIVVFATLGGLVTAGHVIAYNSGRKKGQEKGMQDASKNYEKSFQAAADDVRKEL